MTVIKLGTVDGNELALAVKQVAFAAQKESWPPLDGIRLEIKPGTITLVATDQYRLATRDVTLCCEGEIEPVNVYVKATGLVKAVKPFAKTGTANVMLDDETSGHEPALVLVDGAYRVVMEQVESRFPEYWRNLFPEDQESSATVLLKPLTFAVSEVAKVARKHKATVHLELRNGLLEVSVCGLVDPMFTVLTLFETGISTGSDFDPKYLQDGVTALRGERAEITFYRRPGARTDGNRTVCLAGGGCQYLFMSKRATPASIESEETSDEH